MTEKRFYYAHGIIFDTHKDNHINKIGTIKDLDIGLRIVNWLNELNDENKELRIQYNHIREQSNEFHRIARENVNRVGKLEKENEQLKMIRSDLICELDIVQNELNIAIDEGFAPSTSYKNYMASKKTEYDKFWENKIKTHNNTLKELQE